MKIVTYLNTNKEEVESKKHNIWIGISLGNKYFTKENIKEYIKWALQYTKSTVLIVIGDLIHATNLEVLDRKGSEVALRKALRMGDIKFKECEEIIDTFFAEQKDKIVLARWEESVNDEKYKENLEIVRTEFKQNKEFREFITNLVKESRKDRKERLLKMSPSEVDRLSEYVLNELPHFVNGVQWYSKDIYTLIPYPGLSKLDEVFVGLQNKKVFPELAKKLHITNKIAILEAYA